MGSYAFGNEYGTDQIHVDSYNVSHFLNDSINMNDNIKNRELRILKKIEEYSPKYDKKQINVKESYINTNNQKNNNKKDTDNISKFNISDVKYLHNEMENLEQTNNMLILFIFFLVFIVIIQYSNMNNDKIPYKLMLIPTLTQPQTPNLGTTQQK